MNTSWTDKQIEILKKHYPITENPRFLAAMLKKTLSAVKTKAVKLGLKREHHTGPWNKDRVEQLVKLYPTHTATDVATMIGVSESSVMAKAFILKLRKDPAFKRECSSKGFFQPGHVPFNKGVPMPASTYDKAKATMFRKGNLPANYKPVGSERIAKDGYMEVKVKDPNKWEMKHRQVWVENYGAIPAGMIVKFKDGNKLNLDPENLYLATRVENMQANTYHNYPKEIANLIQLKGALNRQINKHEKHNRSKRNPA